MALRDDLSAIQSASTRAIALVLLSEEDTGFLENDSIKDEDTRLVLTKEQRDQYTAKALPLVNEVLFRAENIRRGSPDVVVGDAEPR